MLEFKEPENIVLDKRKNKFDDVIVKLKENPNQFAIVKKWTDDEKNIKTARVFKSYINKGKLKGFSDGKFSCVLSRENNEIVAFVKFEG
jgi:hypothetical protein